MNNKTYVIYVDDQPVKVSKRIYTVYWQDREREKYLDKLHRRHVVIDIDDVFEGADINTIEFELVKDYESPSDIAIKLETMDLLLKVLNKLPNEEKRLIQALYFNEQTEIEYGHQVGLHQSTINRKKRIILKKLRKLLKNELF